MIFVRVTNEDLSTCECGHLFREGPPGHPGSWGLLGGSSQLGYGYVVTNHGDRKSPKDQVVGPLPNGRTLWLINGGDPNYLRPSWDDPPSSDFYWRKF